MLRATRLRSLARAALQQRRHHKLSVPTSSHFQRRVCCRAFHATRTRFSNGERATKAPATGTASKKSDWGLYFVALSVSAFVLAFHISESTWNWETRDLDATVVMCDSFDVVVENAYVSLQLGGRSRFDYSIVPPSLEGIEFQHTNRHEHMRIKYEIEGPDERAIVFGEVGEEFSEGEFVYLLVQFAGSGEVLELIDNRQDTGA